MTALKKLWHWLHTRTTQGINGSITSYEDDTVKAAEDCGPNDYIGPERDLRAARKEQLAHENWRSRAGPWQMK